jgi:two-component system, chemotaxis family, CheB/CheR fusion protein
LTQSQGTDRQFEDLLEHMKALRGFDFTAYKRTTLARRIQKRMETIHVPTYEDYSARLEADPDEFTQLFDTILINVTGFFRDENPWQYIAEEVIPDIVRQHAPGEAIRIWSAGCSSGEEAYTIAMLLAEAVGEERFREDVKIYATDVDEEALKTARQGAYLAREVKDVPAQYLEKYFERQEALFSFRKDLRRCLIFGRHDLLSDAPISKVDLLICRNTLMYFNSDSQARILARFYFALNETGYLFLGKSEMLLTHQSTFTPVQMKLRIFRKVPKPSTRDRLLIMAQGGLEDLGNQVSNHVRVREAAFETDPDAQLVVDVQGNVTLANSRARALFNIMPTDIGRPLQDLDVSYRPVELRSLINQSSSQMATVEAKDITWTMGGQQLWLDVQVYPLRDNADRVIGSKIVFSDVTDFVFLQQELQNSRNELETSFEELQSTNEELETTNEELQSTIEELETTNEELQSTNEELETMNEELQSANEELETLNDEMRLRTDDMFRTNMFLDTVLKMLEVAAIVLNSDMEVELWNKRSEELWGLRADEVKGKNFFILDIGLPVTELKDHVLKCLSDGEDLRDFTLTARTRTGRDIRCLVSCTPLLGRNREVSGIVLMVQDAEQPGGSGQVRARRPKTT